MQSHAGATSDSKRTSDAEYRTRVHEIFDVCAGLVEALHVRERFGPDLYVTFTGVDPNPILASAQRMFVARLNPSDVIDEWVREFE